MKRRHLSRWRLGVAFTVGGLFWALVVARLFQVQVLEHGRAAALVEQQAQGWIDIAATRGRIFDRQGRVLAADWPCTTFVAAPKQWDTRAQRQRAAKRFSRLKGHSPQHWLEKFDRQPEFIHVVRLADAPTKQRVRAWQDPAIATIEESGRTYPAGSTGTYLLGDVNLDNRGICGVERAFEEYLAGQPARGRVRVDALRQAVIDPLPAFLAKDGNDLYLTIDWRWQEVVEDELLRAVRKYNARGGGAILISPYGAIRAMAYASTGSKSGEARSAACRPVTDLFEPGSIFKAVTATALLSEGIVTCGDSVYADSGVSVFGGRRIRDSEPHGWLTFGESFTVSSNIAFGKWAQPLSESTWYRWLHDFGFGKITDVGLPGEPRGIVPELGRWSELTKAQLAMGHAVSVTALQMVTALAAFANGGNLYRPYLVSAIVDPQGDTLEVGEPQKVRHLIRSDVVETMGKLLARVVTEGTAKPGKSDVIAISGKTGTAQKVKEEGRGYYQNRHIASFVGFFPADAPQVVGIVYLDEPHPLHFGGWTAAPALARMAERLAVMHPEFLRYPDIQEIVSRPADVPDPEPLPEIVPDLIGLPLARAANCAARMGWEVQVEGSGSVCKQDPGPGTSLAAGGTIVIKGRHVTSTAEPGRSQT
jgi:cell division protein FtsI (penicillin-binding protein 3)